MIRFVKYLPITFPELNIQAHSVVKLQICCIWYVSFGLCIRHWLTVTGSFLWFVVNTNSRLSQCLMTSAGAPCTPSQTFEVAYTRSYGCLSWRGYKLQLKFELRQTLQFVMARTALCSASRVKSAALLSGFTLSLSCLLRSPRLAESVMLPSGVCPSVRPTVPSFFLTLIGHVAHTQLWHITWRGQRTFLPVYFNSPIYLNLLFFLHIFFSYFFLFTVIFPQELILLLLLLIFLI